MIRRLLAFLQVAQRPTGIVIHRHQHSWLSPIGWPVRQCTTCGVKERW